jgi:hypothetical protein
VNKKKILKKKFKINKVKDSKNNKEKL